MDENKIVDLLNFEKEKQEKSLKNKTCSCFSYFQTNPIIERMLFFYNKNERNPSTP